MTDEQIIDTTKCKYNTFDGGGTQRTICILDGCFCDCLREKDCYYKQLKRAEQKLAKIKEYCKPKVMMNGTANEILKIIEGKENG